MKYRLLSPWTDLVRDSRVPVLQFSYLVIKPLSRVQTSRCPLRFLTRPCGEGWMSQSLLWWQNAEARGHGDHKVMGQFPDKLIFIECRTFFKTELYQTSSVAVGVIVQAEGSRAAFHQKNPSLFKKQNPSKKESKKKLQRQNFKGKWKVFSLFLASQAPQARKFCFCELPYWFFLHSESILRWFPRYQRKYFSGARFIQKRIQKKTNRRFAPIRIYPKLVFFWMDRSKKKHCSVSWSGKFFLDRTVRVGWDPFHPIV